MSLCGMWYVKFSINVDCSVCGAHAGAFMYLRVQSAKASGLEPRAYLQALVACYPQAALVDQRRRLLPMFYKNN